MKAAGATGRAGAAGRGGGRLAPGRMQGPLAPGGEDEGAWTELLPRDAVNTLHAEESSSGAGALPASQLWFTDGSNMQGWRQDCCLSIACSLHNRGELS